MDSRNKLWDFLFVRKNNVHLVQIKSEVLFVDTWLAL